MKDYIEKKAIYLKKIVEKRGYLLDNIDLENIFEALQSKERCQNCSSTCHCCERFPCIFAPIDFLDISDIEYMTNILDTGLVCIDKNFKKHYVLRPIGRYESYARKEDIYNCCSLYDDKKGCRLNNYFRPSEGLLYYAIPDKNDCIVLYSEYDIDRDYMPYQDILRELDEKYNSWYKVSKMTDVSDEQIKNLVKKITKKTLQTRKNMLYLEGL